MTLALPPPPIKQNPADVYDEKHNKLYHDRSL
jgi:hypothetical protein